MYFDVKAFVSNNFKAFFKTRGEPYRLTPKRFLFLVIWLTVYVLAELINHIFFLLDEIFFPKYHQQAIKQPVFIIGNPRSGTTFLHRLMYNDRGTFTSFTVWEMALAPSITQRKMIWFFAKIGRWIGHPFKKLVRSINKGFEKSKVNPTHPLRLNEAEEDEHIMIHCFASETLFNLYPFLDSVFPYFYFDRDIPKEKQRKILRFYRNMLQRHLYAHGGNKILLSKNPSHSSRIAALDEMFPDAHFIKLVRDPFEAVPSMLNVMSMGLNIFCDPKDPYAYNKELMDLMNYYYFYPVEYFKDKKDKCQFIKYDDLIRHPDDIVEELYRWLELDYDDQFKEFIKQKTQAEHHYKSHHRYPLDKMGLSEAQIFKAYKDVFDFYEFPYHDIERPKREVNCQSNKQTKMWKGQRRPFLKPEKWAKEDTANE
jgi:hypothetical protein